MVHTLARPTCKVHTISNAFPPPTLLKVLLTSLAYNHIRARKSRLHPQLDLPSLDPLPLSASNKLDASLVVSQRAPIRFPAFHQTEFGFFVGARGVFGEVELDDDRAHDLGRFDILSVLLGSVFRGPGLDGAVGVFRATTK